MKINRKGFTLVELLVTILIVGLIISLSTWGIISLINNSKDKDTALSESNLKDAARIYSAQASSNSWKTNENYDAFCVTIGELMNKGLLDKNASINGGYTRNDFIIVKRNKVTFAINSVEMISEDIDDKHKKICIGQNIEDEIIERPEIKTSINYTDRIEIPFTSGNAGSGVKNYTCLYGESSSNINKEGVIEGNKCILDGLKNNKDYYVLIYMNSNKGSSVLAGGDIGYSTKDFNDTMLTIDNDNIIIKYNNENIYDSGSYYFKSSVDTISSNSIQKCTLKNNVFSCVSNNSKNIEKDIWYKINLSNMSLDYSSYSDSFDVNTIVCDKSNNCHKNNNSFDVYNVNFYRNGATLINYGKYNYVMNRCIAIKGESCEVSVPDITIPAEVCGDNSKVSIMYGWNSNMRCEWETNNECDNRSKYGVIRIESYGIYNVDNKRKLSVSKDMYLYAIIKKDYYVLDVNWYLDGFIHCAGLGNYCGTDLPDKNVRYNEVNQALFSLKFNGNYLNAYDNRFSSDYCFDNIVVSKKILNDGNSDFYETYINGYLNGDIIWEIDSLMLNGVEVPYYNMGSFKSGNSSANIFIYSFNVNVNNSNYGKIDFYDNNGNIMVLYGSDGAKLNDYNKLYVAFDTSYEINGNVITLSDGRKIVATPNSGHIFEKWDSQSSSGVINNRIEITAYFK